MESIERLGKPRRSDRSILVDKAPPRGPRPIKITLSRASDRKQILTDAKKLENFQEPFSRIRMKKDTHPAIRKEFARLREIEHKEKDKPENQGKVVEYDHRRRAVLVDGQIVDSFQPVFF